MANGIVLVLFLFFTSVVQPEYVTNEYEKDDPKCPLGPVVTATISARLGNNLWDFMSTLAISRLLPGGFQPYMRLYHFYYISKYFQTPLLPLVEDIPLNCSCWNRSDLLKVNYGARLHYYSVESVKKWSSTDNVVLNSPCVAGEPIMHELEFIKTRLKFKPELIQEANQVFQEIATKFLKQENLTNHQLTFVGVHVRRTDYLQYLKKEEKVDARFFNFGFDYFRNRKEFGTCVFLVLSDDQKWVEDNITSNKTNKDVFLVGSGHLLNPGLDLAILAHANHTIFDFGSFGLFGAVYCGGEVVTSTSYGQSHKFIQYKRFHFFEPVPDKELLALLEHGDYIKRNW